MKAHRVQLQTVSARLDHKFEMAKFIFHIHQNAAVRGGVAVSIAFTVVVVVARVIVIVIVAIAATECGGEDQYG